MSYTHLTYNDRYVISHLIVYGLSYREIGRRLNRHHTTISREVKRNWKGVSRYWHESSQREAEAKKRTARHAQKRSNTKLYNYVTHRIKQEWSPEEIVGRIEQDYPEDFSMHVSTETIYKWVYQDGQAGGDLYQHLRRHHKRRRKQRKYGSKRGLFVDRVSISERPASVDKRARIADWEDDTLEGAKGSDHVATHVDRKSRYLIAAKLSDKKAATMSEKMIRAFHKIPRLFRKTLTLDTEKNLHSLNG